MIGSASWGLWPMPIPPVLQSIGKVSTSPLTGNGFLFPPIPSSGDVTGSAQVQHRVPGNFRFPIHPKFPAVIPCWGCGWTRPPVEFISGRRVGNDQTSFFKDHRVSGTASLPMAAVLEAALAAARLLWPDRAFAQLEQVSMDRAIRLPEDAGVELEWMLEPCPEERLCISAFQPHRGAVGRTGNGSSMRRALCCPAGRSREGDGSEASRPSLWMPYGGDVFDKRMRPISTPIFPGSVWISDPPFAPWRPCGPAAGRPWGGCTSERAGADGNVGFALSPLVLDGALQVIAAALSDGNFEDRERVGLHLPVGVDHAWLAQITDGAAWAHAILQGRGECVFPFGHLRCAACWTTSRERLPCFRGAAWCPSMRVFSKPGQSLPAERLLYHVRWQPRPDPKTSAAVLAAAGGFVFPLQALPERLDALLPELAHAQRFDQYESARADMDALVSLYIMRTLERLGWQPVPGERVQCDSPGRKAQRGGAPPQLLKRFLDILAEDGVLESAGDGWKVVQGVHRREIPPSGPGDHGPRHLRGCRARPGCPLRQPACRGAERSGRPARPSLQGRCVRFRGQALQRIRNGPGIQWAGQGVRGGGASGLAAGPPVAGA